MDDELNILPISSHIRSITPVPVKEVTVGIFNFVVWHLEILKMFSTSVASKAKPQKLMLYSISVLLTVFLFIQYIKGVSIIVCVTIVVVDHYSLWFRCCISIFSFPLLVIEGLRRAFSGRTRPEESQRTIK
jgi:hypothetical protein